MNGQQALAFLKQHQPLPAFASGPVRENFRDALIQLRESPENPEEAVPLLLNCWDGSNKELNHEPIIFTLKSYPKEHVAPHVADGLTRNETESRIWFAEVACVFPDKRYLDGLEEMLESENTNERFVAVCALEQVGGSGARVLAKRRFDLESDPEILGVLEAILEEN